MPLFLNRMNKVCVFICWFTFVSSVVIACRFSVEVHEIGHGLWCYFQGGEPAFIRYNQIQLEPYPAVDTIFLLSGGLFSALVFIILLFIVRKICCFNYAMSLVLVPSIFIQVVNAVLELILPHDTYYSFANPHSASVLLIYVVLLILPFLCLWYRYNAQLRAELSI